MLRRRTTAISSSTSTLLSSLLSSSTSSIRYKGSTGVGGPGSQMGKKSSWTALLDDDDDAQLGNMQQSSRVEKAFKKQVLEETPPELRDSYINTQGHLHPQEKERLMREAQEEALDRASQVHATIQQEAPSSKQQQATSATSQNKSSSTGAAQGLWEPGTNKKHAPTRSFYGGVNEEETAQMNKQTTARKLYTASGEPSLYDAAATTAGHHRPRRERAMSRFFKDNQQRDFTAKKYEDADRDRYSVAMPKLDEAMKQGGYNWEGGSDPGEKSPTHQAKILLDELEQTPSTATGDFSRENPYDSYRNLVSENAGDSNFEMTEQTRANRSVIPGLGPLLDTIYWRLEQSSEYKTAKPQISDKALPFYKRVFADLDVWDRRATMHVLTNYRSAEWLFAIAAALAVFYMTDYQYRNRMLATYDEVLGLDARRGGDRLEYIFVLVTSLLFFRLVLFQPFVVSAIGLTRLGRHVTGRPLGPP